MTESTDPTPTSPDASLEAAPAAATAPATPAAPTDQGAPSAPADLSAAAPPAPRAKTKGVADIVFLIDLTGSMAPCIDALR
jgi:hypothetical protein